MLGGRPLEVSCEWRAINIGFRHVLVASSVGLLAPELEDTKNWLSE